MSPLLLSFLILLTAVGATSTAIGLIYYEKWKTETKKYPWPIAFHTVDVALYREVFAPNGKDILGYEVCMGQKPNEVGTGVWRFPGGFVDPTDLSAEMAVIRECREEVIGPELDPYPVYITSIKTNDYRYRDSRDKIITSFYKIKYVFGPIKAGDDLAEVCWMPVNETSLEKINPIHHYLFLALITNLNKK